MFMEGEDMDTRRRLGVPVALVGVLVLAAVLVPGSPAYAHGGLTYPQTRTYACYLNGLEAGNGGDVDPDNPACAEAIAIAGKDAFWNWFGNLLPNADGRHREVVPDGDLCGPGETFRGFRQARRDWPTTRVQANQAITFRYNAWAQHPGTWYQYITRDDWDPSQPLAWDDLEPVPFDQVTNPPVNGSGPHGAEYTWPATLPDKQGRHIIFSIWERSDSPEAFYNCADVFFGSGPIEWEIGAEPDPDPDPDPDPEPGPTSCDVDYALVSEWAGGLVADVTVTNTGDAAIQGWTLDWMFGGGEQITQAWNVSLTQHEGGHVEARNAGWNATIGAGQSVSFGFQATRDGPIAAPTAFRLNGAQCGT
jgi:predicted carbohydrate-binding protein with CBM5 and CBM33 domain